MGKINLDIRPKVMLIITLFTVILAGIICFIFSYLKALFMISDMDYIIFYDDNNTMLYVNGLMYEYHMDELLVKDTPESGKLFLKSGRSYDIKCVFYSYNYFAIMIDEQYGYYTLHDKAS